MDDKRVVLTPQQVTPPSDMTVLIGSANNFNGVLEHSDYRRRPLLMNSCTQTTSNDFSYINYIEQKEQQLKREKELEEKIKVLEENLRAQTDLLSQIHATSAKTTALLGQQYLYSSQHSVHESTANMNNITSRTPQTNSATVNSEQNAPINSVINPLQQVNSAPGESVKYTIIAEANGNNNGEPIEIQLAEVDGALNLNSSSESGRLEFCYAPEENIDIKSELNGDNNVTVQQPAQTTPTPNEHHYIKRRKTAAEQTEFQSNICSNYFYRDPRMISPANVEKKQKRRGSNSLLPSPKMEDNNGSSTSSQNVIPSPHVFGIDTDNVMVALGPQNTRIPAKVYDNMSWTSPSAATRKLLTTIFDRETLATHSMTGKPSPAYKRHGKPVKEMLNPLAVYDIIFAVTQKCKVSEKEVRNFITSKCADENKMMKIQIRKRTPMREINKENEI